MPFSIKNGFRIMRYRVRDGDFMFAFVLVAILAGIAVAEHSILYAVTWIVGMFLVALLARCWDDPIKLGYEKPQRT
jgi:hypothetical protein